MIRKLFNKLMFKLGYVPIMMPGNGTIIDTKRYNTVRVENVKQISRASYLTSRIPIENHIECMIKEMQRELGQQIWNLGDVMHEAPAHCVPDDKAVHTIKFRVLISTLNK